MRILVLGATGRVGASVVRQAAAAGHEVTAFVRDPARLNVGGVPVQVAVGDVYKPDTIAAALAQRPDAVVVTVGADPLKPATIVADTARALVPAMQAAGVQRYLGITGTAQMPTTLAGRISAAILRLTPVRHAIRDHDAAFPIVAGSGLTWTLAGCPWIKDVPRQPYRLGTVFPGGMKTIAPDDVAELLVRELVEKRFLNQVVGIWY